MTDSIVFHWSCGGLETGTFGDHIFAMRPDGSGLRQVAAARGGCVAGTDGSVTVELLGPVGYSAPSR